MNPAADSTILLVASLLLLLVGLSRWVGRTPISATGLPTDLVTIELKGFGTCASQIADKGLKQLVRAWLVESASPRHLLVDASNGRLKQLSRTEGGRWSELALTGPLAPCVLTPRTDVAAALMSDAQEGARLIQALLAPHLACYGRITLLFDSNQVSSAQLALVRELANITAVNSPFHVSVAEA